MRFDILDEYSTLVPFGLGVSKRNEIAQHSVKEIDAADWGVNAYSSERLTLLPKVLTGLTQIGRRAWPGLTHFRTWMR